MNIAIVFRGQIRGPQGQEIEYFKESIDKIKQSFCEHNITTYLTTWNDEFTPQILEQKLINHVYASPEPSMQYCKQNLTNPYQGFPNWGAVGTYSLFFGTRRVLQNICEDFYKYDYVCLTRPDIQVSIIPEHWFSEDKYVIPEQRRYMEINDQFAVAKPSVAFRTWDFKNLNNLNEIFRTSYNHETAVLKIMQSNGIQYEIRNTDYYKFKW